MRFWLILALMCTVNNVWAQPTLKIGLAPTDSRYSCGEKFQGVLQPDAKSFITLKLEPQGFSSGQVKFDVLYTNNGYKNDILEKMVSYKTTSTTLKIPFYPIKDELPFAINQVVVTAKNGEEMTTATFSYRVLRTMILEKSADASKDCFTMHKAEKITGVYTNTSSQPRMISLLDETINSRQAQALRTMGWFLNISPINYVNFGANRTHANSVSRGMSARTSVTVSTYVATNEAIVITRQMTLFKDAYNVKTVDSCGQIENAGTAHYAHWLVSYPLASLDLQASNPLATLDVGYDDTLNTCPETTAHTAGDEIFIPDEAKPETLRAEVESPEEFNKMNGELNDDSVPVAERKKRYTSWWKRIFKRR